MEHTHGSNPYGSLALSGSTLFGMTSQGGTSNSGVVLKLIQMEADFPHVKYEFRNKWF